MSRSQDQATPLYNESFEQVNNKVLSQEARELNRRLAEQFYDQVLGWICNAESDSRKIDQPFRDTENWFLESEHFQNWFRGDRSFLWCYGSKGSGKTVLARALYEYMCLRGTQDGDNVAVSMISCSFDRSHTPDHLMANMLRQIARQPGTWRKDFVLSNAIEELYRKHGKDGAQKSPTASQVQEVLRDELKRFRTIYVILDGLDELATQEQRTMLLDMLHHLKSAEYSLRVMVFSRKLPDIQDWYSKHGSIKFQSVELVPSREHLLAYVEARIYASDHMKQMIGGDRELVDDILESVYSNASNTYLLAKLHVDRISDQNEVETVKQLQDALSDLQNNFDGAYDGVFDRIRKTWRGNAYKRIEQFLFLVWQAKEPMSAPAIEHALAVLRKDVSTDDKFLQELPKNSVSSSMLVSRCAGLVEMDEISHIVRLTHQTIGKYLGKPLKNTFPAPDLTMAKICLSYLQLPAFTTGAFTANHAVDKAVGRLKEYCFLAYASQYWGYHVHNCADADLHHDVLNLVTNATLLSTVAQAMRICDRNNAWDVDRDVTGLHLCAHFGLTQSVRSLLERSGPELIDRRDSRKTTALMYAVVGKHQDTTRVLLDAGADITSSCARGSTALHRACWNFDELIWKLIVNSSRDISVNSLSQEPRFYQLNALQWAISQNYVDGVNLLLERNDTHVYAWNLHKAASRGYSEILRTLLNHNLFGAEESLRTEHLSRTLITALSHGKVESANVLLDYGADLEWRDRFEATPIIRVIDSGNIQGLQFLWERANRYVKDEFNRGVLHSAGLGSKKTIMEWMLEHDNNLDVNDQSDIGNTPLHDVALEGDNMDVAKVLLSHGANAKLRNHKGKSAVDLALDYDRKGLLKLFLGDHALRIEKSSDIIDPDRLMAVVSRDQEDTNILQSLQRFTGDWLHACNYVPSGKIQPDSPLIKAIRTNKPRSAVFLLDKGADVDGLDRFHMTALHWASRLGYEDLAKELVGQKADINATYPGGCTPAEEAAREDHLNLALYLLEQGDDTTALINRELMPKLLRQACEIGSLTAVQRLSRAGAPLYLRNEAGQNPREMALSKGHHNIVSFIDQHV
ncbi:ankyrin [Phaeosphaeriaceae sp. SRC1lsM3a]|nr:ankyrin [Stagonospora sp. SRC1lsM3a]